ncbi:MAG TPA: transposase [Acidimicrobiales bacterium]|nr:transposase [Acidimicrobiales bacterium]
MSRNAVFVIGVDPHQGSHTAAVLNATEEVIAEFHVDADSNQLDRLLEWAELFSPRRWAVEGAGGTGALLARQLVAAGEEVVDVPPTLSARGGLLDRGRSAKTDAHDARAAAIVALRHANLRTVVAEHGAAVLRLLADRRHDLVAQRTRVVRRLHALLAQLPEGGASAGLSADRAAQVLRRLRPLGAANVERKRQCAEHVAEIRRLDAQLAELRKRTVQAVAASGTSVTEVHGVGPAVAAMVIGDTGWWNASRHRVTSHASMAPPPSTPPAARSNVTASTPVATVGSTMRCTSPRSPSSPTTRPVGSSTCARSPRATRAEKLSGPSIDGSATPSTDTSWPTWGAGPGGQAGTTQKPRDRPHTLTVGSSAKSLPDPPPDRIALSTSTASARPNRGC